MRCLLDTHALLWAVIHPAKLSDQARQTIHDPGSDVLVSSISLWEISLKYGLKRLDLEGLRPEEFPLWVHRSGFVILPLEAELAATYHQLPMVGTHKDPFDRMLVWQAIRAGMTLISHDRIMAAYEPHGLSLLW